MDFSGILGEIEKADPEFHDRISPRRDAIKNLTGFGAKIAVATLPFALNALLKKAYGATPTPAVISTLNFALRLEYFEAAFYRTGLAAATLTIPPSDRTNILTPIANHEVAHVNYLQTALGTAAITQPADTSYDFTAKGNFNSVFNSYSTFLSVAQVLEDTMVRGYKGQTGFLMADATYLTAILNIHSVEARHAAAIRYLRRTTISGAGTTKPWISLGAGNAANDTGISAVDGNYANENSSTQLNVDIAELPGATANSSTPLSASVEAFDEPLTTSAALALLGLFNL